MVVFSPIRLQDALAAARAIGERGGSALIPPARLSDKDIFAIGECALWEGKIFGLRRRVTRWHRGRRAAGG